MAQESKKDTYSYKGWLNSDKFLKRAFAICGYVMVAGLIIGILFYIIIFLSYHLFT
ncbi:MAG: hypothetical protein U9Q06_00020 [Nanoarchaeota archaeon]|nr:hypothetical protein [Nanoarchaeota archaeon]